MATSLFLSPHRSLRGSGVAERIETPAHNAGRLQADVAAALRRARMRGNPHPVALGAIPFDTRQPSALVVPQVSEFVDRNEVLHGGAVELPPILHAQSIPGEERFKQGVRQAVANFGLSEIRKAVLSRLLDVELAGQADAGDIFRRLVARNPSGFQFRLPLADGSELVGVSPELLVRKEGARMESNPLAGSARRDADPARDRQVSDALLRSSKDAYEHRLVTDEIRRVLAPVCQQLSIPEHPSLLSTTAMWHLSTPIEGVLHDPAMGALELACRLHPTPAVCGFPTRLARKLIDLVEPFDRGLFAGMVGWCDDEGNGEWAVTIRCGRVSGNRVQLFAGAGIVADSCPDAEWAETQAKLQTMLGALTARETA